MHYVDEGEIKIVTVEEYNQGSDILGRWDLYWKGKNLYYGYYPGVSIVRAVVAFVVDIPAYAVPAGAFLLLVFPVMHAVVFVVNAWHE